MFQLETKNPISETKNFLKNDFYFNFICQCFIHYFIVLSLIQDNRLLMTITLAFTLIYAFYTDTESVFYLIVGISSYQYSFTVYGDNGAFMLVGVFLLKLFCDNKCSLSKQWFCIACAFIVLLIQIVNDWSMESKGGFLVGLVYVSFFLYLISNIGTLRFDPLKFLAYYSIAFILCTLCIFHSTGGIGAYLKNFLDNPVKNRFGETLRLEAGGAMEVPLYCLAIVSVSIVALICKRGLGIWKMIAIVLIACYALIIGGLTLSRSFLLGVAVIAICTVIGLAIKNIKWLIIFLGCGAIIFGVAYLVAPTLIDTIFSMFISRIENDMGGGSGRMLIWEDCFSKLKLNSYRFLFGGGAFEYLKWHTGVDYGVSAGAHNLLLDIWMSWGLIGLICVLLLVVNVFVCIWEKYGIGELIAYVPFLAFMAFSMTALRTTELTSYAFFLTTILTVYAFAKEKKNDS